MSVLDAVCRPAAAAWATICHLVKFLQFIWRSGSRGFLLWVPDFQMNLRDLTSSYVIGDSILSNGNQTDMSY